QNAFTELGSRSDYRIRAHVIAVTQLGVGRHAGALVDAINGHYLVVVAQHLGEAAAAGGILSGYKYFALLAKQLEQLAVVGVAHHGHV
nr:hypothetical protein [Tanacetum cinerariifolium]